MASLRSSGASTRELRFASVSRRSSVDSSGRRHLQITNLGRGSGSMNAFVISKLVFLLAVGVAGFVGSIFLGRLLAKQPEQLRVALWWLLAATPHFGSGQRNAGRRGPSSANRPKWLAALGVWHLVLRQPL